MNAPDIREANEADIPLCYPLIRQLRPHIPSAEAFAKRWRRQREAGYRILALWSNGHPQALAGFRVTENLIHGRFLYVDDLITDADARAHGYGACLMDRLKAEAVAQGCDKLVLDTGLDNVLAHRFYYRQGLLARALRFSIQLGQA